MKSETASGAALIAGALGTVITMVLHPTASSIEGIVQRSAITQGTHILALACVPLLFLGLLGLHQRVKAAAIWLIGLVAGVFTTSVQSFGLFILGCSAWFVVIGALLCSGPPSRSAMRNP